VQTPLTFMQEEKGRVNISEKPGAHRGQGEEKGGRGGYFLARGGELEKKLRMGAYEFEVHKWLLWLSKYVGLDQGTQSSQSIGGTTRRKKIRTLDVSTRGRVAAHGRAWGEAPGQIRGETSGRHRDPARDKGQGRRPGTMSTDAGEESREGGITTRASTTRRPRNLGLKGNRKKGPIQRKLWEVEVHRQGDPSGGFGGAKVHEMKTPTGLESTRIWQERRGYHLKEDRR